MWTSAEIDCNQSEIFAIHKLKYFWIVFIVFSCSGCGAGCRAMVYWWLMHHLHVRHKLVWSIFNSQCWKEIMRHEKPIFTCIHNLLLNQFTTVRKRLKFSKSLLQQIHQTMILFIFNLAKSLNLKLSLSLVAAVYMYGGFKSKQMNLIREHWLWSLDVVKTAVSVMIFM